MNYVFHLFVYLCIYSVATLGLNFLWGSCGRLSLAHGAYFAIGSYAYALARLSVGLGYVSSLVFGGAVAAILSLPISMLGWRYRGDFFVLVSLAFQVLIFGVITNWFSTTAPLGTLSNLTNGPFGILGIPGPALGGLELKTPPEIAAITAPTFFIVAAGALVLLRSPWGRALRAMKDDELAARGLGKRVQRLLAEGFAIGCGLGGVAGALYASYVGYIDPSLATLDQGVVLLSMLIIGGVGNVRGPIIGAGAYLLLPEILRVAPLSDSFAASARAFVFGLLLVLIIHIRPRGIAGAKTVE